MKVRVSPKVLITILSIVLITGVVAATEIFSARSGSVPADDAKAAQIYPAFLSPVLKLFDPLSRFPIFLNPVLKNNVEVILTATPTSTAAATATPTAMATFTPTPTTKPYPYPDPSQP